MQERRSAVVSTRSAPQGLPAKYGDDDGQDNDDDDDDEDDDER